VEENRVAPWIWIAAGIVLTVLEIVIPSFTIIWFGLAAIVTGLLSYILRTDSLAIQLALWAVLSGVFTYGWFRFFRQETKTLSGQSKESVIGKSGVIVKSTIQPSREASSASPSRYSDPTNGPISPKRPSKSATGE
jgi:membrane protein implicated in regulation of membrane protease activity